MMRKFWHAGDHPIKQELYDRYEVAWLILVGFFTGVFIGLFVGVEIL